MTRKHILANNTIITHKVYENILNLSKDTDSIYIADDESKLHKYNIHDFIQYLKDCGIMWNCLQVRYKNKVLHLV